ncbi:MAG: hypothetical protein B6I37_08250 [Desulfobacteraceae bacterium 4572_35.2]|nr:MAG: hypothetical protein B6I37_08250 [Desulfobacteraceae bacterium 4572_35.2]
MKVGLCHFISPNVSIHITFSFASHNIHTITSLQLKERSPFPFVVYSSVNHRLCWCDYKRLCRSSELYDISNRGKPRGTVTGGNVMREWQSLSHVKWECKYHIVIVPKYRRKVLYGHVRRRLGEI